MDSWQITKYDPQYRDENGWYNRDEWTEYSDIGQKFEGKAFAYEEYEVIEGLYIQAVLLFMEYLSIDKLKLVHYAKIEDASLDVHSTPTMIKLCGSLKEGKVFQRVEIPDLLRLLLRNFIGGKLLSNQGLLVTFDYDYYMSIATLRECNPVIKKINQIGLYEQEYDMYEEIFPEIDKPIEDFWIEVFRRD